MVIIDSHVITVSVRGKLVDLHFIPMIECPDRENSNSRRYITVCYIKKFSPIEIIGCGVAVLHPGEDENPYEGERKALARALEGFPYKERQEVWEGFLANYGVPNPDKPKPSVVWIDEAATLPQNMIDKLAIGNAIIALYTGKEPK